MVCRHDNVDPDKINDAKRISAKAVSTGLQNKLIQIFFFLNMIFYFRTKPSHTALPFTFSCEILVEYNYYRNLIMFFYSGSAALLQIRRRTKTNREKPVLQVCAREV